MPIQVINPVFPNLRHIRPYPQFNIPALGVNAGEAAYSEISDLGFTSVQSYYYKGMQAVDMAYAAGLHCISNDVSADYCSLWSDPGVSEFRPWVEKDRQEIDRVARANVERKPRNVLYVPGHYAYSHRTMFYKQGSLSVSYRLPMFVHDVFLGCYTAMYKYGPEFTCARAMKGETVILCPIGYASAEDFAMDCMRALAYGATGLGLYKPHLAKMYRSSWKLIVDFLKKYGHILAWGNTTIAERGGVYPTFTVKNDLGNMFYVLKDVPKNPIITRQFGTEILRFDVTQSFIVCTYERTQ